MYKLRKVVRKTRRVVALRGITPTLRLISRMAPGRLVQKTNDGITISTNLEESISGYYQITTRSIKENILVLGPVLAELVVLCILSSVKGNCCTSAVHLLYLCCTFSVPPPLFFSYAPGLPL